MSPAPLLLAALMVAPADGHDPKALVAELGSADPAERDAAARGLEALGRDALPALEAAARADDPALRERATALWEAIQRDLMTRASSVRLDFRGQGVGGVLGELMKQTGLALRSDAAAGSFAVQNRPGPAPVAFWEAVERLGLTSVSHHNPGEGRFLTLELRTRPAWTDTTTSGPFRVALTGLHWHRDRSLVGGPWVRIDRFGQRINVPRDDPGGETVAFFGGLEVMVEPRMWFTQEAPARLTEATDDLDQSLVPEAADREAAPRDGAHFASGAGRGVTQSLAAFRLRPTDRPGRVARLRGVVPLMLHVRRPAPALVIPLADAAGRTFRGEGAEFEVVSVNDSPTRTSVTMIVRLDVAKAGLPDDPDPQLVTTRLLFLGAHQLELVDAEGNVLADSAGSGGGGGKTPAVYRWTISSSRIGGATHLRYYGMLRVPAEAAFDFRDVPLP
jgi:hypothetical protein